MEMKNMFELDFGTTVKFYPYRTARVSDIILVINRNAEEARKFEMDLNKAAKADRTDNHTCYAISNRYGKTIYILCSDFKMYVGLGIEEGSW